MTAMMDALLHEMTSSFGLSADIYALVLARIALTALHAGSPDERDRARELLRILLRLRADDPQDLLSGGWDRRQPG